MLRHGGRIVLLFILLTLTAAGRAAAQAPPPGKLDVQTFNQAVDNTPYVTQYGSRVPGHLEFGVGLTFNYQRNPFAIYNVDADGNRSDVRASVVKDLLMGELYGYLGLFRWVSVGLSMPLALYMSGSTLTSTGEPSPGGDLKAFAWGDLGIHVKAKIWDFPRVGFGLAAVLTVTTPTGQFAEQFVGEESATFRPRLVAEYRHRFFSVAANVGGVFRLQETSFYDGTFAQGQQATYGVAFAVRPAPKLGLRIVGELYGRTDFSTHVDRNPLEATLGVGYLLPRGVHLFAGGGAGILAGIGTPDFRVYLGVRWSPSFKDSDGDGVPDEQDKCPEQKEDRDGFEDKDGCPDPDNDKDGIPDEKDKCPNEPEDFDNFEDEDGCPDLDNDKDGIPDKQDNCPNHPGPAATKGCPPDMLDDDGDGIPNTRDKCPNEPEDKDGFQDEDGCPDPDNDQDGIPDQHDKCPNEPEDKDGFQDADGCPDPDNDGDGVCDDNPTIQGSLEKHKSRCIGADKCPDKPETINGVKDEDGCPDGGAAGVALSAKGGPGYMGLFLTPGVNEWFTKDGQSLTKAATSVLAQLAMHLRLRQYDPLAKIVVMGFVGPEVAAAEAKTQSQQYADAIRQFLVQAGIRGDRLGAVGAGSANPVCTGRGGTCQRRNRRVEFFITEIRK
jgi:outer membrane protein OmpA-like peptidoglycan-associated protein